MVSSKILSFTYFAHKPVFPLMLYLVGKRRALIPPSVGYVNENLKPIPEEVRFTLIYKGYLSFLSRQKLVLSLLLC